MLRILSQIDRFSLLLVATVLLASLLPATGNFAMVVEGFATTAVMLLFFLHGARLPHEAVIAGIAHWRLHALVLATSFVIFPLLGLAMAPVGGILGLDPALAAGLLYLSCLPSTVQSSIAFTSIARGNVAAAVCAASLSNIAGIFITPLLVGFLLSSEGGMSFSAIGSLITQLLLPFLAGQIARRWIGEWVARNKQWLSPIDRGAILLMVYSAFSEAVLGGIWHRISAHDMLAVMGLSAILLALILYFTRWAARRADMPIEDEITILFCGSKKSLVTGIPMASVLFPSAVAGTIVLPLMIFHQLQLMVCAVIAQSYAARSRSPD